MYRKILTSLFIILTFIAGSASGADKAIPTDSRIKTYVYNENDVFLVVVNTGFQSSIELEKGEKIQTLSLGDAYSWNITSLDNRLFIKPLEDNVRTNMTIITNMRNYQFDIVSKSTPANDSDISYVVRFYYPKAKTR